MNKYNIQIEFMVEENDVNHDNFDNLDLLIENIKSRSSLYSLAYILRVGIPNIEPKINIQQIKN